MQVHLLDGADGSSLVDLSVPGFPCQGLGAYGGAADAAGNFWISNKQPNGGQSLLARIDRETHEVDVWPAPVVAYGITVDANGRVWVTAALGANSGALPELPGAASAARFDPTTETWALVNNHVARGEGGIQQGPDGRMWMTFWNGFDATGAKGIAWIDPTTLQISDPFEIQPDDLGDNNVWYPNGVSIDHEGRIWVVAIGGTATRYDPKTEEIANYELGWAYSYSDMTGWGLQNTACTPAGWIIGSRRHTRSTARPRRVDARASADSRRAGRAHLRRSLACRVCTRSSSSTTARARLHGSAGTRSRRSAPIL
ncbi:MAG: hypothetical protein U0168_24335 [Nannocystaceae bacterium]